MKTTLSIILLGIIFLLSYHSVFAREKWYPWSPTPTPTVNLLTSFTPTISPTVIPTAIPTATPTTSTPPASIPQGSTGGGTGSSNQAQHPVCSAPFRAPVLQGFEISGPGSVTLSWWGSPNVSKYSIIYGYTPQGLDYGEDNIPASSTSLTINDLQPFNHLWAIVQAWQGGCVESSNLFDPLIQ
jgi:hypothetical protein